MAGLASTKISVNGKTVKASYDVKVGDVIAVQFGERRVKVEVLNLNDNANKTDASGMYREI